MKCIEILIAKPDEVGGKCHYFGRFFDEVNERLIKIDWKIVARPV